MNHLHFAPLAAMGLAALASFLPTHAQDASKPATAEESDWVDLLEGGTMDLWMPGSSNAKVKRTEIGTQWSLKDGVLALDKEAEGRGGHIVTKKSYFDFELKFEFMICHNGNSGVKYRTTEGLGLEYQIIDDEHYRDNKNPTHRTACLYELAAVPATRTLHPAGKAWNTGRIVAKGNQLEHWLNGEKVMTIEVDSDEWKERFAKSKYRVHESFARNPGPILLQDHSDSVSYRKLFIRELK